MTFVTRCQYFISGHPRGLPLGTLLKETIDGLLTERPLSFFGRYQVCDRLAVARDRYCFAAFGCAEEFCELSLSLYSLYFAHCSTFNQSCQLYRFYHRDLMRLTSHAGTHTSETTGFLRVPMPFDLHLNRIADGYPGGSGAAAWDDVAGVELHACHPLDDRGHLLVTLWGMKGGASIGDGVRM